MNTFKRLLLIFLCLFSLIVTFLFGWYFFTTKGVVLHPEKLILSEDRLELYDDKNEKIHAVSSTLEQDLSMEELPEKVKFAFIDTEDKRFYAHHGFDYLRIGKAMLKNIKSRSFQQGASTISQQLIKNTHLSQEKTIKRKLKEFKLTKQLERNYSKDEILCKYLSSIYFGHNCFGLRSASAFYFGKSPSELTLADGAILAGLVRSPNNYSPFRNPENCQRRKSVVLSLMRKQKHITKEEEQQAKNQPLPIETPSKNAEKSYFNRVFEELERLSDEKGFRLNGKIRIHTYFDGDLQKQLSQLKNPTSDCIYAVCDNKRSAFQAYYSTIGAPKRLPGSLIKPLLVYAPALETGLLSPATPILDEKTDFNGYQPSNFGNQYYGYTSARECLAKSLNVPTVKILSSFGVKNASEYLKKMSLPVLEEDLSLALALGGMKNGFTMPQLISAYTVFPNSGNFEPCCFIKEIYLNDVKIYARRNAKKRVFSEETAYLTTDMLKSAVKDGTAKKLRSLPFSIAAKTGTSGTAKGNTDAYIISYTPKHTVGVWLGFADNSLFQTTGGGECANVAYSINEYLGKTRENVDFSKPKSVVSISLDKIDYSTMHHITIADENAPVQYKFSEIFNEKYLPLSRDKKFTNPFIAKPSSRFDGEKFCIDFALLPDYYDYEIIRYDYTTHTTVYKGGWIEEFIDYLPKEDKTYQYAIIPFYKENQGEKILFPSITTSPKTPVIPEIPPDIIDDDWWNK